jgi:hypothetical protein
MIRNLPAQSAGCTTWLRSQSSGRAGVRIITMKLEMSSHRPRLVPPHRPDPLMLWLARLLAVRNQHILHAFDARQADNARRTAPGLPPAGRERRTVLAALSASPP